MSNARIQISKAHNKVSGDINEMVQAETSHLNLDMLVKQDDPMIVSNDLYEEEPTLNKD